MTRLGLMTHVGSMLLAGVLTALPLPALAQTSPMTCEVALGGTPVASAGDGAIGRCCLVDAESDFNSLNSLVDGGIYTATGGVPIRASICGADELAAIPQSSLVPPNTDLVVTGSIPEKPPIEEPPEEEP